MKMYDELAPWWPLLSSPEDYEEEATFYQEQLRRIHRGDIKTVLELGSGGGNNALYFKQNFQMTLVDLSEPMLAVSRELNPTCEHIQGDMRTVRLNRQFDAVFIQDAIMYMTTREQLLEAMTTAWVHVRPGGAVLFAPDVLKETFREEHDHGGHDGLETAFRYLSWSHDPDPTDETFVVDYAFMARLASHEVQHASDRHIEGLFARQVWLNLMAQVGFEEAAAIPFDHSELEPGTYEVFVARRPAREPS